MWRVGLVLAALCFGPGALAGEPVQEFHVRSASERYDFRLTLQGRCPSSAVDTDRCVRPGELVVSRKGSETELATIHLESVSAVVLPNGELFVGTAPLYEYQGTIIAGDFNFDGRDDFAVQISDNGGPYGGPTFAVFLATAGGPPFVRSEALSRLTEETLGFFRVDAKRKRLVTTAKSGCCYHVTEEFAVVRDEPVPVRRIIEDATYDGYWLETRETLIDGRWHRETRRHRRDRD